MLRGWGEAAAMAPATMQRAASGVTLRRLAQRLSLYPAAVLLLQAGHGVRKAEPVPCKRVPRQQIARGLHGCEDAVQQLCHHCGGRASLLAQAVAQRRHHAVKLGAGQGAGCKQGGGGVG